MTKEEVINKWEKELHHMDLIMKKNRWEKREINPKIKIRYNVILSMLEDIKQLNEETRKDSVKNCECGGHWRYTSKNNYYCDNCGKTINNI